MKGKMMCAVKDRALDAFMQPFFVDSIGVAVRSFSDEVNRAESPMNSHPEDYDLYHVGFFDEDTGNVSSSGEVRCIARAQDVIRPRS